MAGHGDAGDHGGARARLPRDYGVNLVTAVLILLANLLADCLYAVADPRIKYA